MTKAAIYIRWSTEDQGEGTTLQVQMESCRQYCDRQGWNVPDELVIVDDGYSGGSLHRPGLTRLRQMIEEGQVDTIVVYRLDRLSRNLADATNLVDKEFKNRAVVRSATEEVHPEADEGWLNYSFRAAFADYERRVIRQRTMAGRLRRHKEGRKAHGRAPYGWVNTNRPGFLEIHPEEAEIVRQLFRRCAYENMGMPALSRWCNGQGIPSPQGSKWHQSVIRKMLTNPIYGGRIVFGQRKHLKHHKDEPGKWIQMQEPTVDVEADPASLPPIITRELWEMAQQAIDQRGEMNLRGRGVSNPRLLSGLLYCRCGSRMGPKANGKKTHHRNYGDFYYRCYRDAEVEPCAVQSGYFEGSMLDAQIETALFEHLNSAAIRQGLVQRVREQERDQTALLLTRQRQTQQDLSQLEKELAFIDKQYRIEEITIAEARRLRATIEDEAATLRKQIAEIEVGLSQAEKAKTRYAILMAQLDLTARWDTLSTLEKKQVMRHFIDRIEAYRPRLSENADVLISWKFGPPSDLQVAQPVRRGSRYRPRTAGDGQEAL